MVTTNSQPWPLVFWEGNKLMCFTSTHMYSHTVYIVHIITTQCAKLYVREF